MNKDKGSKERKKIYVNAKERDAILYAVDFINNIAEGCDNEKNARAIFKQAEILEALWRKSTKQRRRDR